MRRLLAIPLVLLLALAGCSDDDESVDTGTGAGTGDDPAATEPGSPGEPAGGPVGGGEYVATAVTEGGEDRPLVAGTELRITFVPVEGEADALPQMTITAGCNTLGASYDVVGAVLHVGEGFGTEMGCEPELMEQDTWVAGVLTGEVGWSLDGDTLTLTSGEVVITLVDRAVASPDADLAGPTWTLDTIIEGETASTVPAGVVASITFADDGSATFESGCNSGELRYEEASDSTFRVTERMVTVAGCEDERTAVETAFLAVLTDTVTWSVTEQRLTLTSADGSTGLGFTATP